MPWPSFEIVFESPRKSDYLVVIPAINEGNRLHRLLERIVELGIQETLDVLIADGGSTDQSTNTDFLKQRGVRHLLIKTGAGGLGAQLQGAYKFAIQAGYMGVITIDGNDKDRPETILQMRDQLVAGFDFVQGSRFIPGGRHENTPISRLVAIRMIHAPLISLSSGMRWTDTTQGFRAYSRRLLSDGKLNMYREALADYKLLFYISHRAPKLGFHCVEIPTTRIYPVGEPTPTKIRGLKAQAKVLESLFRVCLGQFDS